jgi:hypothetical protein
MTISRVASRGFPEALAIDHLIAMVGPRPGCAPVTRDPSGSNARRGVVRAALRARAWDRALYWAGVYAKEQGAPDHLVADQHAEDAIEDGHEVMYQTEAPKHQYRCFLDTLKSGAPIVLDAAPEDAPRAP